MVQKTKILNKFIISTTPCKSHSWTCSTPVIVECHNKSINCAGFVYLDLPEDKSIPDTVSPHDAFQHLCLLPPVGKSQQPALQRGVGLPKDLPKNMQTHTLAIRNSISIVIIIIILYCRSMLHSCKIEVK